MCMLLSCAAPEPEECFKSRQASVEAPGAISPSDIAYGDADPEPRSLHLACHKVDAVSLWIQSDVA
jgi:hypothetical protein